MSFVGEVTGDGYMSLIEDAFKDSYLMRSDRQKPNVVEKMPYDLHLEAVLGMIQIVCIILLNLRFNYILVIMCETWNIYTPN